MRLKFLSWIACLSCGALTVVGQNNAAPKTISLSLDDALRRALEQNYAIRLGHFTPQTARLNLEGIYGAYDPVFSASAGQNFSKRTGAFNSDLGQAFSGGESWRRDFAAEFTGALPTGTRYGLDWDLARSNGKGFDNLGNLLNQPAEYGSSVGVSVTQPLLKDFWIDSTRLNTRTAKIEIKKADLALQYLIMGIVNQTALAYYDLIEARDQVKVREMALQLKDQFLSETQKKVAAGTMASLDEKQAQSEQATARANLIRAHSNAEQAENRLKGLISDNFASIHTTVLEPSEKLLAMSQPINVIESWRTGLEQRPDFIQKKHSIEQEKIQLKYTKNQLYPALDIQGSYGRAGLGGNAYDSLDTIGDNRFPRYGGGLVLTVPLSRKSERAAHRIQKISVEEALMRLKEAEEDIIRSIDTEVKKVRSAFAAIESTREARVFAEAALDAEQKKLENGKSTNFQVLELQDNLTQARAAEISALTAYNKSLQDFYYVEGTTLQRNKVVIQLK
jgi:outer membrane protein